MFGPQPEIWIVSGIPGAGKTSVARRLAERLGSAAHIEGDALALAVTAGRVLPGEEPADESDRQIELCIRNQCLLARSFSDARFVPVIDYVVVYQRWLDAYRAYLAGGRLHFVVLAPPWKVAVARDAARGEKHVAELWTHLDGVLRSELAGTGLWLDTSGLSIEETVDAILAEPKQSVVP